jgi:histidine ammonia-lyase
LGRFTAQFAAEVRIRSVSTTGAMAIPLAHAINDHMTGVPLGIIATREALDAVRRLVTLELTVAAQAVELRGATILVPRGIQDLRPGTREAFAFVREPIAFLTARPTSDPGSQRPCHRRRG